MNESNEASIAQTDGAGRNRGTGQWLPTEYGYIGIIIVATAACYWRVTENSFVWDSVHFVLLNDHIATLSWENVKWVAVNAHRANWQPMTWISHMIDFELFGQHPAGHHVMNVIVHLANSLLLYVLLKRLIGLVGIEYERVALIAAIASLIFAIHPQHVESVVMISQRKDTLYTFFTLLSCLCYLRQAQHVSEDVTSVRRGRYWYAMCLAFFALALMSKPMAVTLPVVFMLLDVFPLRRVNLSFMAANLNRLIVNKIPMLVLTLLVSYITLQTQAMAMPSDEYLSLAQRVVNTIHNIGFYQYKFFVPLNLSPFYPFPPMQDLFNPGYWLPSLLFALAVTLAGVVLWQRDHRFLLIGWLCYLVILSPVSGIIHVGPAASTDHYTYMATIPSCLLLALLIVSSVRLQQTVRLIAISVGCSYLIAFGLLTHAQVSIWKTPFQLWNYVIDLHPGAALPHQNLAAAHIMIGEFDVALEHLNLLKSWGLDINDLLVQTLIMAGRSRQAVDLYQEMINSGVYSREQVEIYRQERDALVRDEGAR